MYGMSSTGTIVDTTPLLPWRPAILSPGWMRRFTARNTLTIFSTPGARSSPCGDLAALVGEALLELLLVRVDLLLRAFDGVVGVVVLHAQLEPLVLLAGRRGTHR